MDPERVRSIIANVMSVLDGSNERGTDLLFGCGGAAGTILLWWGHLTHPAVFDALFLQGRLRLLPLELLIVLGLPFVMTFSLANALFFKKPAEKALDKPNGLMSAYFQQQESQRKWWIGVISGVASAINFLLMFIVSVL